MDEYIQNEAPATEETTTGNDNAPTVLGDEDIWDFDTTGAETSGDESTGSEAAETNQSTGNAEKPDGAEEDEDTPDFLPVTYNHEDKMLSKKEAQTYAQKGMNYDKIKSQLDEANSINEQYKQYENFLNDVKGNFATIEELMIDTRAKMVIDNEKAKGNTITYESAKEAVTKAMPKLPDAGKIRASKAVKEFEYYRSGLSVKDIPQSVWDDTKLTGNLAAAYMDYECKQKDKEIESLKKELASEKQKNKNASRTTGGSKSSGQQSSARSYLDAIWDSL